MDPLPARIPFDHLVGIMDRIFDDCEDDVECLAVRLGGLEAEVRDELLVSDILNAWQVFFFFFRTDPGDLIRERLELEPASALAGGIRMDATDFLELIFLIREKKPVIAVSDGEKVVAVFSGKNAFGQGREFLESPEYQ
jgi:hypothetical protein